MLQNFLCTVKQFSCTQVHTVKTTGLHIKKKTNFFLCIIRNTYLCSNVFEHSFDFCGEFLDIFLTYGSVVSVIICIFNYFWIKIVFLLYLFFDKVFWKRVIHREFFNFLPIVFFVNHLRRGFCFCNTGFLLAFFSTTAEHTSFDCVFLFLKQVAFF